MYQNIKSLSSILSNCNKYFLSNNQQTVSSYQLSIIFKLFIIDFLKPTFEKNYYLTLLLMDSQALLKNRQEHEILNYNEIDLKCALKSIHVTSIEKIVNNPRTNFDEEKKKTIKQYNKFKKYKHIRKWEKIISEDTRSEDSCNIKLISFNILAQGLLETHPHLYRNHEKLSLNWSFRKNLLTQEIIESGAHIICLQEMQENHLNEFLKPFHDRGFDYLFKKRTNNKIDGLLLMYRKNLFNLLDFSKVEFYQNDVELLNRDNVGIVAKFSLKEKPTTNFVIATTHLLYNPKRNDVKLGQVQILFAEIERLSFIKNTLLGPLYLPIILAGDFNLTPHTRLYRFITEGSIKFIGKEKSLENNDSKFSSNCLIPPHLYITDECQHFNVLIKRMSGFENKKIMKKTGNLPAINKYNELYELVNPTIKSYQKIEISDGHFVTFSSGLLIHPFQLKSVYNHMDCKEKNEVTTFQNKWITVDYIFFSDSVDLQLLERYTLPTAEYCKEFYPTIPNMKIGSDHFCLGATFKLIKK